MNDEFKLNVCEIFLSLQGEGGYAGLPCIFIRLAGCNLRCKWCDSSYAWENGTLMALKDILEKTRSFKTNLVMITGGEPLSQNDTYELTDTLICSGYKVIINTNGSYPLERLHKDAIKMVDVKCPRSGEESSFLLSNISCLTAEDEANFVICDRKDFDWALNFIENHMNLSPATIRFTPAFNILEPSLLADWILRVENIKIRLGMQLHKIIWGERKGV